MESFLVLLYGVAFIAVIYYMVQFTPKPVPKDGPKELSQELWPWSLTKYSFWPQWFNNKDGFGHPGHPNDFGHEGGYAYTGRQDPRWDCSFEGDGQGKDMLGGNFARSGMIGYTGREPHLHCTTQLPYNEFKKLYEEEDKQYNEFKKLYEEEDKQYNEFKKAK